MCIYLQRDVVLRFVLDSSGAGVEAEEEAHHARRGPGRRRVAATRAQVDGQHCNLLGPILSKYLPFIYLSICPCIHLSIFSSMYLSIH